MSAVKAWSAFGTHKARPDAYAQDVVASQLRDWYRRGQRAFRQCLDIPGVDNIEQFNDMLQQLKTHERDGFCMGWQSDAWAYSNDKPFAVEGTTHPATEDNHGYTD